MGIQHYEELIVWQKAMLLAKECYQVTKGFPREELFGLTAQIRRAAVSVPANIAEGHSRSHTKEYLHHLSVARGSLAELETELMLSKDVGLLGEEALRQCLSLSGEISRMLSTLRKSLKSRI